MDVGSGGRADISSGAAVGTKVVLELITVFLFEAFDVGENGLFIFFL